MTRFILSLLTLLSLISCAPDEVRRPKVSTEKFFDMGPSLSDIDWSGNSFHREDISLFNSFSQEIESSDFFESLKNLFMVERYPVQNFELKLFRYAYKVYAHSFALEALFEIANQEKDVVKKKEILDFYDLVKDRQAFSLESYKENLKKLIGPDLVARMNILETSEAIISQARKLQRFRWNDSNSLQQFLDRILTLKELLKKKSKIGGYDILLEEADELIVEAKSLNVDQDFLRQLVYLGDSFYASGSTATSIEPQDSPYLETALGLYGGDLYQVWVSRIQDIRRSLSKAFANVKINILEPKEDRELEEPELVVLQLSEELSSLGNRLRDQGLSNLVVDQVNRKVTELQPIVKLAISNLTEMGVSTPLNTNLKLFSEVLGRLEETKLFSPSLMGRIQSEVAFPIDISEYLDLIQSFDRDSKMQAALAQTILVKLWQYQKAQLDKKVKEIEELASSGECRKYFKHAKSKRESRVLQSQILPEECKNIPNLSNIWNRFGYYIDELGKAFGNKSLVKALYLCDEEDLEWLARVDKDNLKLNDSNWNVIWRPYLSFISLKIENFLESAGVDGFVGSVEQSVSRAMLRKVTIRLTQELRQFDAIIFNQIKSSISEMDYDWSHDFYNRIKGLAKVELNNRLLKGNTKINLLESKTVLADKASGEWSFTSDSSQIRSGSLAVTESLSSGALSLWANSYAVEASNDKNAIKSFEIINKAVSFIGTRNYFGELIPSLNMDTGSAVPKFLDIYTYAYEEKNFGIPNEFVVTKGAQLDTYSVLYDRSFSIESQASLLEAGAQIVRLMADWTTSPLDRSLHELKYEGIDFFPKNSLVELGLGVSSIVLRNLQKGGIALFDKKRQEIVYDSGNLAELASKVTSATVLPLYETKGSQSQEIELKGLAKYMIALADFIEVADQSTLSRSNTALVLSNETSKTQITELIKAVDLLKKLYIAMANFLSTRFINENKLFYSSFNILTKQTSKTVNLEDQWYAQLALLRAYKMWDGKIYFWLAQDNYFALNHQYLDLETGFYKETKKDSWIIPERSLSYRVLREWKLFSKDEAFKLRLDLLTAITNAHKTFLSENL